MKLEIVETSRFRKSLKRVRKQKRLDEAVFSDVVNNLAIQNKLDKKFKDHQLTGNMRLFRECHLSSDLLLVYRVKEKALVLSLVDIGSHSYLFK